MVREEIVKWLAENLEYIKHEVSGERRMDRVQQSLGRTTFRLASAHCFFNYQWFL